MDISKLNSKMVLHFSLHSLFLFKAEHTILLNNTFCFQRQCSLGNRAFRNTTSDLKTLTNELKSKNWNMKKLLKGKIGHKSGSCVSLQLKLLKKRLYPHVEDVLS